MPRPSGSDHGRRMQVYLPAFVCLLLLYPSGTECQSNATDSPALTDVTIEQISVWRRVWAGEEVEVNLALRNRGADDAEVQVGWQTSAITAVLERGQTELTIPAEQTREVRFVFHAPEVARRTKVICRVVAESATGKAESSRQVSVLPRWEADALAAPLSGQTVGLIDFSRSIAPLLQKGGVAFQELTNSVAVRYFTGNIVLVVASDMLMAQPALQRELLAATERGTRIAWFGEGRAEAGFSTSLFDAETAPLASQPLPVIDSTIAAPGHPVVAELAPDDLSHWRDVSGVTKLGPSLAWPKSGNFRALVRAASAGLPLVLEVPWGKGSIIFCQPPVLGCVEEEPAAHLLLRGLLRACTMPMPDLAPAALFAAPEGRWDKLLTDIGIVADHNPGSVAKGRLAILCVDEESEYWTGADSSVRLEAARNHLARGGKCLVLGAYPESQPVLDALGLKTTVTVRSFSRVEPIQTVSSHRSPEMWGILAADLDSLGPGYATVLASEQIDFMELVEPGVIWKCSPPGATGTVICAHLRPLDEPSTTDRAVLIQMLTNIGVLIELPGDKGPW